MKNEVFYFLLMLEFEDLNEVCDYLTIELMKLNK